MPKAVYHNHEKQLPTVGFKPDIPHTAARSVTMRPMKPN